MTTRRIGAFSSDEKDETPKEGLGLLERMRATPIVAAVNNMEMLPVALASPVHAIYLLTGNPVSIPGILAEARSRRKICLIDIDFLDGLARDRHAVAFLALHGADGIASTKSDVLRSAKGLGMLSVLRTFAIDSAAVAATVKSLGQFVPDAVEILPAAVAPRVVPRLRSAHPALHLIAGGLIENLQEMEALFKAGVNSVSVSNPRLWVI